MKIMRRLLLVLAMTAVLPLAARRYSNPVLHLDYSDPDVCRAGDDYYMTASSFNCFPGLPILHSRDLVHWELTGSALWDYCDEFRTSVQHGNGVWAPAIRYHDGWFYIFVGDPDRGIFMVRTQDPSGQWEAPVWVVRAKGFIDPCPFWDEDGSAWLSHGCAGSRAGVKSVLFMAPMSPDGTRLLAPSRIVYDGHLSQPTIEGTKLYKRDGWYYIFSPAGGVATGWQTVLRSKNLYGPWEERIVMAWAPGTVNGPHQGAWINDAAGADWFLHFQDKGAYGRIVHLQPMTWTPDGWPVIGEDPDGDGIGQPVPAWEAPAAGPAEAGPHGRGKTLPYGLPYEWQFPTVPSPYWSMAIADGVRLYSVLQDGEGLWDCPNILLQKFPAERFSVTACIRFRPNPALKGEQAGFAVTGNDYASLRLTDTGEEAVLEYVECHDADKGGTEQSSIIASLPYEYEDIPHERESGNVPPVKYRSIPEAEIWVKLEVRPRPVEGNVPDAVCSFSWSRDGKRYTAASKRTFTAKPEMWIGAKFGFYCNRPVRKNDSGWADIVRISVSAPDGQSLSTL